jgi:antitoxin (DNA-binding transcriptional repressor) of toxin-antitoxin stability system
MKASIVDLRYKTKEILQALDRNEEVTITYHGKVRGKIVPAKRKGKSVKVSIKDTAFFGMHKHHTEPVENVMKRLRGGRYRDI